LAKKPAYSRVGEGRGGASICAFSVRPVQEKTLLFCIYSCTQKGKKEKKSFEMIAAKRIKNYKEKTTPFYTK